MLQINAFPIQGPLGSGDGLAVGIMSISVRSLAILLLTQGAAFFDVPSAHFVQRLGIRSILIEHQRLIATVETTEVIEPQGLAVYRDALSQRTLNLAGRNIPRRDVESWRADDAVILKESRVQDSPIFDR